MTLKKVMFGIGLVLVILGWAIGTATAIQLLPILAIVGLIYASVWGKKDVRVASLVLSVIMLWVNITVLSGADILFWTFVTLAFAKK